MAGPLGYQVHSDMYAFLYAGAIIKSMTDIEHQLAASGGKLAPLKAHWSGTPPGWKEGGDIVPLLKSPLTKTPFPPKPFTCDKDFSAELAKQVTSDFSLCKGGADHGFPGRCAIGLGPVWGMRSNISNWIVPNDAADNPFAALAGADALKWSYDDTVAKPIAEATRSGRSSGGWVDWSCESFNDKDVILGKPGATTGRRRRALGALSPAGPPGRALGRGPNEKCPGMQLYDPKCNCQVPGETKRSKKACWHRDVSYAVSARPKGGKAAWITFKVPANTMREGHIYLCNGDRKNAYAKQDKTKWAFHTASRGKVKKNVTPHAPKHADGQGAPKVEGGFAMPNHWCSCMCAISGISADERAADFYLGLELKENADIYFVVAQ